MSYQLNNLLGKLRISDQGDAVARIKVSVMSQVNELGFSRGFSWRVKFIFAGAAFLAVLVTGSVMTEIAEPGNPLFAVRSSAEDTFYSTQTAVDVTLAGMWNQ